jgi:hypothetical protein
MPRQSWKKIRSIADPQTLASAERKTQTILDALIRQDHSEDDPADPVAASEWEAFPDEEHKPRL